MRWVSPPRRKRRVKKMDNGKKIKRCSCGKFLKKSDRKYCGVCKELKDLRKKIKYAEDETKFFREQTNKCQNKNKELSKELTSIKKGRKFPMWLHIKARDWNITPEHLQKVITTIAPIADTFDIEYGTYDGRR